MNQRIDAMKLPMIQIVIIASEEISEHFYLQVRLEKKQDCSYQGEALNVPTAL